LSATNGNNLRISLNVRVVVFSFDFFEWANKKFKCILTKKKKKLYFPCQVLVVLTDPAHLQWN